MSIFIVSKQTSAWQFVFFFLMIRRPPRSTSQIFAALPNYDEETSTRLQIFLDNNDFGPGKIDGKMGEFFRKALISYKHAYGMRETGFVDKSGLDQVPVTFTS